MARDTVPDRGEGPEPRTEAGQRLLNELGESPLPGARYAHDVARRHIIAIEAAALAAHPSPALDGLAIGDDGKYHCRGCDAHDIDGSEPPQEPERPAP